MRMMRAARGSMLRKSFANARLASSAMAPASSTPVGPPPTMTRFSSRLRSLEREQDAPANFGGILDALQARRERLPIIVAEISVACARGEDEIIVRDASTALDQDRARSDVDAADLPEHDGDVPVGADDAADRRGDVGRRQAGRGNLIKQGFEQVVIL